MSMFTHGARYCHAGTYTRLLVGGALWMSDTPAEAGDHTPFIDQIIDTHAESVLITGMGLGMVVNAALQIPHVRRVDVIEANGDVIALVGDHYQRMAHRHDVQLTIHHGDARTCIDQFDDSADQFDTAWHDIWQSISDVNVPEMDAIIAHYRPIVSGKQMCWAESECRDFLSYLLRN